MGCGFPAPSRITANWLTFHDAVVAPERSNFQRLPSTSPPYAYLATAEARALSVYAETCARPDGVAGEPAVVTRSATIDPSATLSTYRWPLPSPAVLL